MKTTTHFAANTLWEFIFCTHPIVISRRSRPPRAVFNLQWHLSTFSSTRGLALFSKLQNLSRWGSILPPYTLPGPLTALGLTWKNFLSTSLTALKAAASTSTMAASCTKLAFPRTAPAEMSTGIVLTVAVRMLREERDPVRKSTSHLAGHTRACARVHEGFPTAQALLPCPSPGWHLRSLHTPVVLRGAVPLLPMSL